MHSCSLCGKTMATAGGLEIHMELSHPPEAPAPGSQPVLAPPPRAVATSPHRTRDWRIPFRGFDSTIPLTGLMVLALLAGGIGAALHRATGGERLAAVSGLSSTPTPPTTALSTASDRGQAPAAAPGSGSTTLCQRVIGALTSGASRRTVDLADLMRAGTFAVLPLPGFEHPTILGLNRYDTVQQYLDGTPVVDPALWQSKMAADGFRTAEAIGFQQGQDFYGAEALRFASPASASDFNRATLSAVCASGVMAQARAVPNLSGGLMYVRMSAGPPFRASFVAGDTVVHLNICECVEAPDQEALAGQWAQAVAAQVGAA